MLCSMKNIGNNYCQLKGQVVHFKDNALHRCNFKHSQPRLRILQLKDITVDFYNQNEQSR